MHAPLKGRGAWTCARASSDQSAGAIAVSRGAAGQPGREGHEVEVSGDAGAGGGGFAAVRDGGVLGRSRPGRRTWSGQPTPGAIDFQPGVTPLRHDAIFFHNVILLPIITVIALFVLALLLLVHRPLQQAGQPDAGALEPQHRRSRSSGPWCRC